MTTILVGAFVGGVFGGTMLPPILDMIWGIETSAKKAWVWAKIGALLGAAVGTFIVIVTGDLR